MRRAVTSRHQRDSQQRNSNSETLNNETRTRLGASYVPIEGVHIHSSKAVKYNQLNIQSCLSIAQCNSCLTFQSQQNKQRSAEISCIIVLQSPCSIAVCNLQIDF